jgi:hypothetical protein
MAIWPERHHFRDMRTGASVIDVGGFIIAEGYRAQRIAQVEANRISYLWDALTEEFAKHMLAGTSSGIRPRGRLAEYEQTGHAGHTAQAILIAACARRCA